MKHYFTGKPCSRGHVANRLLSDRSCTLCNNEKRKRYYAADPEKYRLERRERYAQNPDKERTVAKVRSAEWRKENPDHAGMKKAKIQWKERNVGKVKADRVKRRLAKMHRTPTWLDATQNAEIEFTYIYCNALRSIGMNYHVDHIVPLQGKQASGLHVPWNLQAIHARKNLSKANKLPA